MPKEIIQKKMVQISVRCTPQQKKDVQFKKDVRNYIATHETTLECNPIYMFHQRLLTEMFDKLTEKSKLEFLKSNKI